MMTGTRDIRIDNKTAGNRPDINPMTTVGMSFSQVRNLTFSRYSTLEMIPTTATGIAQKTIRAVMKPRTANLRITFCHHEILREFHTTSFGLTPMYRGDMWRAW